MTVLKKVRRLLQHEVDFPREQKTLLEASALYEQVRGVRVPRVLQPLCTDTITAITEETGAKITDEVRGMPAWRRLLVKGEQTIVDRLLSRTRAAVAAAKSAPLAR